MPSIANATWDHVAADCLDELERQCQACSTPVSPNPVLLEENLRAYVILLSGHFQAFCRDLYSECAQALAIAVPLPMSLAVQTQCLAKMELDKGNARIEVLKNDFNRFGINLGSALNFEPDNAVRITHLDLLNKWRNYSAHRESSMPKTGSLDLASLQAWRNSCGELVTELEKIMYNHMRDVLGKIPW